MILKIIGIVLLSLFLLLFLYPLRLTFSFAHGDGKNSGWLRLHPLLTLRSVAVTLLDTEKPKKERKKKRKKTKDKEDKKKTESEKKQKEKQPRQMAPVYELILTVIELLGKFKRRVKRLRIRLDFEYGFPDPSRTGEVTGAIYALLPPLFGDTRKSRWKLRFYPLWCVEETAASVSGDVRVNALSALVMFGPMLPDIIKLIPKRKKNTEVKK